LQKNNHITAHLYICLPSV